MRLFKFLALAFTCIAAVNSCQEPEIGPEADPFIEIDKLQIEAPYQGMETTVNINSNTKWTLARTDESGNPIDWVKFDKLSYQGSLELGVKVMENPTQEERKALITFDADGEKAFLEVVQAANPNEPVIPDEPETPDTPVDGNKKVLTFDFTSAPQEGWPTAQGDAASNMNKTVVYTLDGVSYNFILREAPGSKGEKIFWRHDGEKDYFALAAPYRYLGLPIVEGYALETVKIVLGNKQASIGYITDEIGGITADTHPRAVSEEADLNLDAGTEIVFDVYSTYPSTQYYLYCKKLNVIVSTLQLTYVPADDSGMTEPENPEPENPEPENPEPENPEPENPEPENPEPENPAPAETMELEFDFATAAQDGWPMEKGDSESNMNKTVTYTLDGKPYNFILLEAPGSKGEKIYWKSEEFFVLEAQYRYLGLPIVDGYALTTVDCTVGKQVAQTASYVTSSIGGITANDHPATDTAAQSWNKEVGTVITYEVNATDAAKQYYLYCKSKGTYMSKLKLTYTKL